MPGRGAGQGPAGRGLPGGLRAAPCPEQGAVVVGEGGLKASALSSMNLCMKEKNQAVKGDAPGKFKIPLESGEECGPRSSLPHSLPRRPAQPGVPSPALRAPGASGDALSHRTWPLLSHPGSEGLPVGTWSPRALGLSSVLSLHGSCPAPGLGPPSLLSAASDEPDQVASVLASGGLCPPSSEAPRGVQKACCSPTCVQHVCVYFPRWAYGPWEAPPPQPGSPLFGLSQGGKEVIVVATDYKTYAIMNIILNRGGKPSSVLKLYSEPMASRSSLGEPGPSGRGQEKPRGQTGGGLGRAGRSRDWLGREGVPGGPSQPRPHPRRPDLGAQ